MSAETFKVAVVQMASHPDDAMAKAAKVAARLREAAGQGALQCVKIRSHAF